jgi:Neuraminidase (sialidase)
MTGVSQPISSTTENMMKSTRKSVQKSTGSSWTSPPLSKIVPYVNNGSKHVGALKVSLTSRGWVPSPPVPSGAQASLMMKKTLKNNQVHNLITMGNDSEGEVMKQLLGLVMSDD